MNSISRSVVRRSLSTRAFRLRSSDGSVGLARPAQAAIRHYSLDRPGGGGGFFSPRSAGGGSGNDALEISHWPITKVNTILNIVPQGKRFVVERLGKLHAIHESGFFFAVPVVDQISYIIDVRERAVDIPPQSAITRDNVSVEVSGNLFIRVADPEKAAYGARNPLYAVMMVRTIHLAERFFHPLRLTSYRNAFERQINIACAIGDEVSRFIDFCPIVSIGGFLKLLSEQVGDR